MKKAFLILAIFFAAYNAQCVACLAAELVTSKTLIEKADFYDNKEILYAGEAVGDIMQRGGFFWVNVLEGQDAIGVWAPLSQRETINYTGDYRHEGDIIEIRGIFHKACKEHGGDLDIHAIEIKTVKQGSVADYKIDRQKVVAAVIFSVAALAAGVFYTIQKRRQD